MNHTCLDLGLVSYGLDYKSELMTYKKMWNRTIIPPMTTDLDRDLFEDNLHVSSEHTSSMRRCELCHYTDIEAREHRLVVTRTDVIHAAYEQTDRHFILTPRLRLRSSLCLRCIGWSIPSTVFCYLSTSTTKDHSSRNFLCWCPVSPAASSQCGRNRPSLYHQDGTKRLLP